MSFWKGKNQFKHLEIVPGGTFKGFGAVDTNERVYYVNNITGAAGAGGLSWNDAFDEPSSAITAAETFRQLGGLAPAVSTNDYIRTTIVIQGTANAYAELADPGEHINFIGLGDNMLGNAAGIARIGADAGAETGGLVCTAEMRGDYFYNIQFQAGRNSYSVYLTKAFRSTFEYCGFFTNGAPVNQPEANFYAYGDCGGIHIKDCHWGNASGSNAGAKYGMYINGSRWHICLVENSHITGRTAGVHVTSTAANSWGSVFRNSYIGQDSSAGCLKGIKDLTNPGHIIYQNCFLRADDPADLSDDVTRLVGCVAGTAFVST